MGPRQLPAFERFVQRVRTAATPELLRRQTAQGWGGIIVRWRNPILALSGLLAVLSVGLLLISARPQATLLLVAVFAIGGLCGVAFERTRVRRPGPPPGDPPRGH